ncbi:hypothetical protein KJ068_22350 [bacterium]|nr:hypothetical protein [bacterium]
MRPLIPTPAELVAAPELVEGELVAVPELVEGELVEAKLRARLSHVSPRLIERR